jgi:hypothetical protein
MPLPPHLRPAGRWAADTLHTLVFWTLGLALSVLLVVQLYVACSNQLEVPAFVERALERRLAAAGMHASFGRTRFDPSGRVLIENVRVTLPGFDEPLITASAVYARLDLWALLRRRFEPLELRLAGASLRVPAMFSPSGRPDEIVRDLNADLFPRGAELEVANLDFRLGELAVSAHGLVHLGGLQVGQRTRLPVTQLLAQHYGAVTRQFAGAIALLGVLDHPILHLELSPSESHGAKVEASLVARGLHLAAPAGVDAAGLRLTSEFPLLNSTDPVEVNAWADRVSVPRFAVEARGLRARLETERPAGRTPAAPDLKFLRLSAADVVAQGVEARAPSVTVTTGPWPKLQVEFHGRPLDEPLAVRADVDVGAQTAAVRIEGQLAPALLDVIGARLHRDLRRFVSPAEPIAFSGEADLGPGWTRLRRVDGRFSAHHLDTWQHLKITAVSGRVEFDGRRLYASDLFTQFGDNFARGSYEMDVPTLRYRFLLAGRLRPLDILPWFPTQPWWGNLFGNFRFPGPPPLANMEWRGQWPTDHETALFLSVDAGPMAVNQGEAWDRVYGRLFIRPHFDDGLEFSITQGSRGATGTFARWYDPKAPPAKPGGSPGMIRRLDVDVASTLDLTPVPRMWPKENDPPEILSLFAFDRPPALRLTGRFDWPGARGELHKTLHLEGQADSAFRFHGFPLDRTVFTAEVKDDDFLVDPLAFGFADGSVTGRVQVSGTGAGRKIALTADLKDGSLARAIEIVQNYSAKGPPTKPVIASQFLKNMANVRLVDLSVAAEGAYADTLSYRGQGTALVQGPELMKVPLLSFLTPLFPFAELRFTTARADFMISGPQLTFPAVTVTGAHSRIDAHGTYAVDRHDLDFYATVNPLQESKSLVGQAFNLVLALPAQITQVRVTGPLDKLKPVFVAGPTNILRSLFVPGSRTSGSPAAAAPTPLAHPAPAATSEPTVP